MSISLACSVSRVSSVVMGSKKLSSEGWVSSAFGAMGCEATACGEVARGPLGEDFRADAAGCSAGLRAARSPSDSIQRGNRRSVRGAAPGLESAVFSAAVTLIAQRNKSESPTIPRARKDARAKPGFTTEADGHRSMATRGSPSIKWVWPVSRPAQDRAGT